MNPVDHPEQYDSFLLCDERSPGIAKLGGPLLDHGWEKQRAKGSGGGETVHNGDDLVEFTAELYLWKDNLVDHFARWAEWKPLLRRPIEKGSSKALDIYHPQLAELGVTSVVCTKEGSLEPDGKGAARVKLSFCQYSPVKPNQAAGKPKGSATTPKKSSDTPDPNKDLKDKITDLEKQFKEAG